MPRINNIQTRRDTAANWTSANPVLAAGEIGLETNTGNFKFGNGTTAWNSLAYFQVSNTYSIPSGSRINNIPVGWATSDSIVITSTTSFKYELLNSSGTVLNTYNGTSVSFSVPAGTTTLAITNSAGSSGTVTVVRTIFSPVSSTQKFFLLTSTQSITLDTSYDVVVFGGGGGAAGSMGTHNTLQWRLGGGGGSGFFSAGVLSAGTYTATIAAAGAGGAGFPGGGSPTNGAAGGTTSIGSFAAAGGNGGIAATQNHTAGAGGNGRSGGGGGAGGTNGFSVFVGGGAGGTNGGNGAAGQNGNLSNGAAGGTGTGAAYSASAIFSRIFQGSLAPGLDGGAGATHTGQDTNGGGGNGGFGGGGGGARLGPSNDQYGLSGAAGGSGAIYLIERL